MERNTKNITFHWIPENVKNLLELHVIGEDVISIHQLENEQILLLKMQPFLGNGINMVYSKLILNEVIFLNILNLVRLPLLVIFQMRQIFI